VINTNRRLLFLYLEEKQKLQNAKQKRRFLYLTIDYITQSNLVANPERRDLMAEYRRRWEDNIVACRLKAEYLSQRGRPLLGNGSVSTVLHLFL
jgi:hypothetical protein